MNKQFIISVVVLFVVTMVLGFIVHGLLLSEAYQASGLFRSDEDSQNYFQYMLLAHLCHGHWPDLGLPHGQTGQTVAATGYPLWHRHCPVGDHSHVYDLLRCSTHAARVGYSTAYLRLHCHGDRWNCHRVCEQVTIS